MFSDLLLTLSVRFFLLILYCLNQLGNILNIKAMFSGNCSVVHFVRDSGAGYSFRY